MRFDRNMFRRTLDIRAGDEDNIDISNLPQLDCWDGIEPDPIVAARLMKAFRAQIELGEGTPDSLHGDLIQAIDDNDVDYVANELSGFFTSETFHGIAGRTADAEAFKADDVERFSTLDCILSLGRAFDGLGLASPIHASDRALLRKNFDDILTFATEFFGVDLAPPQVGGIFGYSYKGPLYPYKYIMQIYTARRVREMTPGGGSCLEIGGGCGFLAYISMLIDACPHYTIIDAPLGNMLQGYFLLNSKFSDRVQLFGEEAPDTDEVIRIYPENAIDNFDRNEFDLVVNQDSLLEMPVEKASSYIEKVPAICSSNFLSINDEFIRQRGTVNTLVGKDRRYKRAYRIPFWFQHGYMEELYLVSG